MMQKHEYKTITYYKLKKEILLAIIAQVNTNLTILLKLFILGKAYLASEMRHQFKP